MCGRFALTASGEELAEAFELDQVPVLSPRYNIAPSQPVLVVRPTIDGRREAASLPWGFPAPAGAGARLLINARAETAHRLPGFRDSFRHRRCLVPASGFFEWQRSAQPRQPFYFYPRGGRLFALAGLWRPATPAGACVILTTAANSVAQPIHDRMPAILAPADYARWLAPDPPDPGILAPLPADRISAYPVGPEVSDARHDTARCLQPVRTLFD